MNWKVLIFVGFVSYGAYQHFSHRAIKHGAGEIATNEPIQSTPTTAPFQLDDFTIIPLADYTIEARLLSIENYSLDAGAKLSPTDLAVGWGPMSDEAVLSKMQISQSGRFFLWHVDSMPTPQHEIEIHAANMHIIPANDAVKSQLKKIKVGQVVTIKGQLVEAKTAKGWTWRSSLSREDTGNGACELMYVTELSAK